MVEESITFWQSRGRKKNIGMTVRLEGLGQHVYF